MQVACSARYAEVKFVDLCAIFGSSPQCTRPAGTPFLYQEGHMKQTPETNTQDLVQLRRMVTAIFEHWQLSSSDQLSLMGRLDRFSGGDDCKEIERIGLLLRIHKSLRLLFPRNLELAYSWMSTPNKAFGGLTPVQHVERLDLSGLHEVSTYLAGQIGR